jgi:hypothetical protein
MAEPQVAKAAAKVEEMGTLVSLKDRDTAFEELLGLSAPTLGVARKAEAVEDHGDLRMIRTIDAYVDVRCLAKELFCFGIPPFGIALATARSERCRSDETVRTLAFESADDDENG